MKRVVTARLYIEEEVLAGMTAQELVKSAANAGSYMTEERAQEVINDMKRDLEARAERQRRIEEEEAKRKAEQEADFEEYSDNTAEEIANETTEE